MSVEVLGQLIRKARKEKKLSQADLGKLVGMSRATISGLENNTVAEIGLRKVENLLSVLGYDLTAATKRQRPSLRDIVATGGFHGDDHGDR